MKKKFLFVCASNLDRSPAAASLFENSEDVEAKSCGINNHSRTPISKELIEWADRIFVMEHQHKDYLTTTFKSARNKWILVLNISSNYCRNDKELIDILHQKLAYWINNKS